MSQSFKRVGKKKVKRNNYSVFFWQRNIPLKNDPEIHLEMRRNGNNARLRSAAPSRRQSCSLLHNASDKHTFDIFVTTTTRHTLLPSCVTLHPPHSGVDERLCNVSWLIHQSFFIKFSPPPHPQHPRHLKLLPRPQLLFSPQLEMSWFLIRYLRSIQLHPTTHTQHLSVLAFPLYSRSEWYKNVRVNDRCRVVIINKKIKKIVLNPRGFRTLN
jgi:hypothetical protein